MRRISIWLVSFALCLGFLTVPIAANSTEIENVSIEKVYDRDKDSEEVKRSVNRLITYYSQEDRLNLLYSLEQLKRQELGVYEIWKDVIEAWDYIENEMVENIAVTPDGIDHPEKHAFIVLGFALTEEGEMKDELIGRLEVAKASAEKYPDSYVLVTGGVEKNGWTEGQRMKDWLVAEGINEERIIVEEKAPHTAGNATNSFEILYKEYDVETVSIITSQYHLKRGTILYYAESVIKAKELGVDPIRVLLDFNAGWYREDKTSEPLILKGQSLRTIARVPQENLSPITTTMTGLHIVGSQKYLLHEDLDMQVVSIDSLNYQLDLTDHVVFEGFQNEVPGVYEMEVSFHDGKKLHQTQFLYEVIDILPLTALVKQLETLDLSQYTDSTVKALQDKLLLAHKLLDNAKEYKQEDIDLLYSSLLKAKEGLTMKEDKPGTDKPGTDKPGTDKPGTDKPGDKPIIDTPGTESLPSTGLGSPLMNLAPVIFSLGYALFKKNEE